MAQDLASALNGLQMTCKTSLVASAAGLSGCLDLLGLVKIANTPSDQSIVAPLKTYNSHIQGQVCEQTDLDAVKQAIANNCKEDIKKPPVVVLDSTVKNYEPVRELLLLKKKNWNGRWCLTEILGQAETAANTPFSKDKLLELFQGNAQGFLDMMNKLPKGTYCNTCGKGVLSKATVLVGKTNPSAIQTMSQAADNKCGKGFTPKDGSLPKDIEADDSSAGRMHVEARSMIMLVMAACVLDRIL